jgi:hypothetical protein
MVTFSFQANTPSSARTKQMKFSFNPIKNTEKESARVDPIPKLQAHFLFAITESFRVCAEKGWCDHTTDELRRKGMIRVSVPPSIKQEYNDLKTKVIAEATSAIRLAAYCS